MKPTMVKLVRSPSPSGRSRSQGPRVSTSLRAVKRTVVAALAALPLLLATSPARAAAPVPPFGTNDFGGFRDVLPPGTNGLVNATQAAAFRTRGARPSHNDDQLAMYRDLLTTSSDRLPDFFKDA